MKIEDFKISANIVFSIVTVSLMLTITSIFGMYFKWDYAIHLFFGSLIFALPCWLIAFYDLNKSKVYNKSFWLSSMILMPTVTPFFYLLRKKHILLNGR